MYNYHSLFSASLPTPTCNMTGADVGRKKKVKQFNVTAKECGFDLGDPVLSEATFKQYLHQLECPFNIDTHLQSVVDWLLGVAVRYEYENTAKEHPELRCGLASLDPSPLALHSDPGKSALDIDPSNPTFSTGVKALAKIMQVTQHPDPSVLLEAVTIVIQEKLSDSALEAAKSDKAGADVGRKKKVKQFNVTAKECGFDLGDPVLSEAAKVLRLLHMQELRDLQTNINEVIVAVQAITANPKTDQTLGRVGK